MDSQTTMLQKLEALINTYSTNYTSPDAISVLQKTFQSHNITIEDWNQLLTFVQENFETLDLPGLYALLDQIIDTIQNLDVDVDCYSKAESDARFEPIINNEHKLGADLVDDTSSTHKFVTESEKTTWSGKQDALSFDLTPTLGSNNPVTSGGVKSYVDEAVSNVYKYQGSKTVAQLNSLEVDSSMHGYVYNVSDSGTLSNGSVQVLAGDNVSIVYNEATSTYTWDKLAGTFTVDLTPYVTLDTAQTITAVKTFINTTVTSKIRPSNNNVSDIGESGKGYKDLYLGGKAYIPDIVVSAHDFVFYRDDGVTPAFIIGNASGTTTTNYTFVPRITDTLSLGSSSKKWNNGYFAGTVYTPAIEAASLLSFKINGVSKLEFDGSYLYPSSDNSVRLGLANRRFKEAHFAGQIYAENTPNVINASDIASNNVLTQAQFDLITNGKMTLIKGLFLSYNNSILLPSYEETNGIRGMLIQTGALQTIANYYIDKSTKVIAINYATRINLNCLSYVNGKLIPGYPSSPTVKQYLTYDTDNSLKYTSPDITAEDFTIQ